MVTVGWESASGASQKRMTGPSAHRRRCLPCVSPAILGGMRKNIAWAFCLLFVLAVSATSWAHAPIQLAAQGDWPAYGKDAGGTRYSAESQINRSNVNRLKVAWTYRTGANDKPTNLKRKAAFEATPILVDGKLLLSTPYDHVIALEPETGAKVWEYDPGVDLARNFSEVSSRGVSAWQDPLGKTSAPCGLRIFIGTLDARLIALDGETGKPGTEVGANGTVDLNKDAATCRRSGRAVTR